MADPLFIIDIGPDGAVATHPPRVELPVFVAPLPPDQIGTNFNTIRPHMVVLACMRLPGHSFAFDSSLVHADAESRFVKFADLMLKLQAQDDHSPKRFTPCSVFGHADPTGTENYNRMLSGRRAMAIYGMLVRDTAIWDQLEAGYQGDQWGMKSYQMMLGTPLRNSDTPGAPPDAEAFYQGAQDGKQGSQTTDAIKAYQDSRGITPKTGTIGPKTKKHLFLDYMDTICHDPTGMPFKLDPETDFLARKKDGKLRGDVQGCGEFNPIMLLSEQQETDFKPKEMHEARNEAYAEDRRVLVYAFLQGTQIDPAKWPCPAALGEDTASCKKRFWSDADTVRLKRDPEEERHFKDTRDTMACRFYHAFAFQSPCEAGTRLWVVRFRMDGPDRKPVPLANIRYVLTAGDASSAPVMRGTLSDKGELRVPVFDEHTKMSLKLDSWTLQFHSWFASEPGGKKAAPDTSKTDAMGHFPDEDKFLSFDFDAGALLTDGSDLASKQRLYNLGSGENLPADWKAPEFKAAVSDYQRSRKNRGLSVSGTLDDPTKDSLKKEHELEDVATEAESESI